MKLNSLVKWNVAGAGAPDKRIVEGLGHQKKNYEKEVGDKKFEVKEVTLAVFAIESSTKITVSQGDLQRSEIY